MNLETLEAAQASTPTMSSQLKAGLSVLHRDVTVTAHELPAFLAQVILQPLFLLFVFGKVLGSLGYTQGNYAQLLFPGLVALTVVMTGMQSLAFPLVAEFGWTMEIEDRLLAPMPHWLVAAEKVVFATMRALVAALIMIPVGIVVLGGIPWRWEGFPLFVGMLLFGAVLGSSIGMVVGTLVTPTMINIVFSLIFTPLLFTGCSQYPWPSLSRIRWFQILTAANPMTYVSEGLRAAMVPYVPHMPAWVCLAALAGWVPALLLVGRAGFRRRTVL